MMTKTLKGAAICLAAFMAISGTPAVAEGFPTKSIKVVVPYAAGGQGDVNARLIVNKIEQLGLLDQPWSL